MKQLLFFIVFVLLSSIAFGQKKIEKTLKELNKQSVPYIYPDELKKMNDVVLLDTRKKEEYKVSHLKNAIWVGYDSFQEESLKKKLAHNNVNIVVYCSIGVRSEDIGEKLLKAGYSNVKNLYGGIFLWKNKGNSIYSTPTFETDSIHAYDKQWGKLLTKGIKVYNAIRD